MENKTKIIFNDATLGFVLEALGYEINSFGYVEYKSGQKVLNTEGKPFRAVDIIEIHKDNFYTKNSDIVNRWIYHSPMMNTWFVSENEHEAFADLVFKADCVITPKSIDQDEVLFKVGSVVCDLNSNILEIVSLYEPDGNPVKLEYLYTGYDPEYQLWLLYNNFDIYESNIISRVLTCKSVDDSLQDIGRSEPKVGSIVRNLDKNYKVLSWEIITEDKLNKLINKNKK